MKIIFEKSVSGRRGVTPPACDVQNIKIPEKYLRRSPPDLCELSELDVVRHFTELSRGNFGVDTNFYPLGSCTMKYNPKVCEKIAALDGFANLHPMLSRLPNGEELTRGAMTVISELEKLLCEITGMDAFTLTPMAGAHGEFAGMAIIAAYHRKNNNAHKTEVLIPDESHGTNPASAAALGYEIKTVPTDTSSGLLDIEKFKRALSDKTAAVMMTNPNTLGLFNPQIKEIAEAARARGAMMYYDGANLNAVMGKFRPGDADFDVIHLNLHKTFATPHGGGGPGAGPVGVKKFLQEYLPNIYLREVRKNRDDKNCGHQDNNRQDNSCQGNSCQDNCRQDNRHHDINRRDNNQQADNDHHNNDHQHSIGRITPFFGNFSVYLKAYAYILMCGGKGLMQISEQAVLNANYIMHSLKNFYDVPYLKTCMHECVVTPTKSMLANGVKAVDIAKSLIDRGFHPPTVYFPLVVKEAMMIEPTETESKETIDAFAAAMTEIAKLAASDPEQLRRAPVTTLVGRLDEVKAAKDFDVAFIRK